MWLDDRLMKIHSPLGHKTNVTLISDPYSNTNPCSSHGKSWRCQKRSTKSLIALSHLYHNQINSRLLQRFVISDHQGWHNIISKFEWSIVTVTAFFYSECDLWTIWPPLTPCFVFQPTSKHHGIILVQVTNSSSTISSLGLRTDRMGK